MYGCSKEIGAAMKVKRTKQFKILLVVLGGLLIIRSNGLMAEETPTPPTLPEKFHYYVTPLTVFPEHRILTQAVKAESTSSFYDFDAHIKYKEKLRRMLSVDLSPHLQMGLERIKAGPISQQKKDIIALSPQLQPVASPDKGARGYGIEVRIKFD